VLDISGEAAIFASVCLTYIPPSGCATHLDYVLDSSLLRQHFWYLIQWGAMGYKLVYALREQDHELFKVPDCR
jgi:hypothetical protein